MKTRAKKFLKGSTQFCLSPLQGFKSKVGLLLAYSNQCGSEVN